MSSEGDRVTKFKLSGGNFDLTGIPANHVQELLYYRNLFMAAAETVWKRDHSRRRLPREFEALVQMSFLLADGCTQVTVLHHVPDGEQLTFVSLTEQSQARIDAMFEQIVAGQVPDDVQPREFAALEKIGSTLQPGQGFTFREGTPAPISYDVDTRQAFLESLDDSAERSTLIGVVKSLNVNQSFTIRPLNSAQLSGRFSDPVNFNNFKTALTVERQNLVWVDCDVLYDPKTRKPRSIRDVHNVGPFPPVHPDEVGDVSRLASLTEDWFDGDGERLKPEVLKAAVEVINAARAAGVPRPRIGAEPEGSITLEWIGYPSGTVLYVEDADAITVLHTNAQTHETTHESGITTADQAVALLADLRQS